ncbi:RagB/SusD family nutrient uptake outer membrane protein [Myroides profundi]|uniref:SusD family protein n=1 Tax=Myroides profundi TaxID=480520 RepID=A0AAJ4W6E0_MYRPR|nr:RagB/SusD family nutrient uptake outer membrane protein [Myroides profundi]AJH15048.1 glycan metabolism protein [Myroides profundi]SER45854.1 SusD family protein [Myroides profundi]
MKRLFVFILSITAFTACSLEEKNQEEISGDGVINSISKAYNVLSQAYLSLPVSGEEFTILSNDLQPSYLINMKPDTKLLYSWQAQEIRNNSGHVWTSYYKALVHINALLATEQYIANKTEEWDYIKGNAMVLKAYIYFDLLQLYSKRYDPSALGIIAKDNLVVENNKRLTQQESITVIKSLLDQGIDLMKKHTQQYNYLMTNAAAKNLEAQVFLFTKEFELAEKTARALTEEFPELPNTETSYGSMWNTDFSQNKTNVFWIRTNQKNPNNYLSYDFTKGDYLYINHLVAFTKGDIRANKSQYAYEMLALNNEGKMENRSLLGKYKTEYKDFSQRNIVLSRNTESYFILIESLIEQGKLSEATQYLNTFLTAVNCPLIEQGQSRSSLYLIMQSEKQKEFIGEKINLFDLKRWNVESIRYLPDSNNRLSTVANTDYRWTWPIPDSELRYNPNAVQNERWETIK